MGNNLSVLQQRGIIRQSSPHSESPSGSLRRTSSAAHQVLLDIRDAAKRHTVDCIEDPSLQPLPNGQRLLVASNLHNNEDLLPHYILQLLHVLVQLPEGSAYVSIYESGSTDRSGKLGPTPSLTMHVVSESPYCIGYLRP